MSVVNDMLNDLQKNQEKSSPFDYIHIQDKQNGKLVFIKVITFFLILSTLYLITNLLAINSPTSLDKNIESTKTTKDTKQIIKINHTKKNEIVEKTPKLTVISSKEEQLQKKTSLTKSTVLNLANRKEKTVRTIKREKLIIKKTSEKDKAEKKLSNIIEHWSRTSTSNNKKKLKDLLYSYTDLSELWLQALSFLSSNGLTKKRLYNDLLFESLNYFPTEKKLLLLSAKKYFTDGNYIKSISQIQKIDVSEHSPTTYQLAGLAYQKLERHHKAIAEYKKLLATNPSRGDINMALGISYEAIKQQFKANSHFNTALKDKNLSRLQKQFIEQQLVAHSG